MYIYIKYHLEGDTDMEDPDPNTANYVIDIVIMLAVLLFNALAVSGKTAITTLNDAVLQKAADDGNKKAKKIVKLTDSANKFVNALRAFNFFMCAMGAACAVLGFAAPLCRMTGIENEWLALAAAMGTVIIFTVLFTTVATALPKKLGSAKAESTAYRLVGYISFVNAVFAPVFAVCNGIAGGMSRMFGVDPNADDENVTEEEILMMVDAGKEIGVIEESQKAMITNIFEFDDINAADVMTHRTDIVAVNINESFDDVINLAISEGCSRIPAYDEDIDDIKGVIYVKDLLKYVGHELPEGGLAQIMRSAYFVPETKKCGDLFTEMTEKRIQLCIVSDEYGGTAGLVTIEDLIESIVGNIHDEYDVETDEIEQINDSTFTVEGITNIGEVSELLGIDLPDGDYETLAGMIISIIERIPEDGETFSVETAGCRFTVEEVADRRIERVRIDKLEKPSEEE